MKKNNFKKQIEIRMQGMGYQKISFYNFGTSFIKRLDNGLYLTVFIFSSRFDKDAFTGDFYLSWFPNYLDADSPDAIYLKRIGSFLTVDERKKLLNNAKANVSKMGRDAWWYKDDIDVIENFLSAINIGEKRFLAQENIFERVVNNSALLSLRERLLEIINIAQDKNYQFTTLSYQPKSNPFKIDPVWYKASEVVCSKKYVSKQVVSDMAIKAFNYYTFRQLYGNYLLENK